MQRYSQSFDPEPLRALRDLLVPHLCDVLDRTDFLGGLDPVFVGLHAYTDASFGRSYRDTAHVAMPHHIRRPRSERITTIVLPRTPWLYTVFHEFGHVLHEFTGFIVLSPCTDYGATNTHEAFADDFACWFYDRIWLEREPHPPFPDDQAVAFFEMLWSGA